MSVILPVLAIGWSAYLLATYQTDRAFDVAFGVIVYLTIRRALKYAFFGRK